MKVKSMFSKGEDLYIVFSPLNSSEVDRTSSLVGKDVEIKERKEKRSVNANSFYWSLVNKIAIKIESVPAEVHNKMISDYGVEWLDKNGNRTFVQLPIDALYQKEETLHLKPTSRTSVNQNGDLYRTFVLMKPSHLYNTAEFSRLLDGAISEASQIGIYVGSEEWVEQIKSTLK